MSSEALVEGPNGVYGAWETQGQVKFARMEAASAKPDPAVAAPGPGKDRKHPALAVNAAGQALLVWSEGTGWQRGGALVWQVFDKGGKPTAEKGRVESGIPTWSLPTVVARKDGSFLIIH
jgi:hypothetical protein